MATDFAPMSTRLPPVTGKDFRIRPLKRGDRDAVFKLLAADGWAVPIVDQDTAISWVVQHPEIESFVAHDATSYSRVQGLITMSHRPQLRVGGRIACIDVFVVAPEQRHRGIGHDLLTQALRRSEALACKRVEIHLPPERDERQIFFEGSGFVRATNDLWVRPGPSRR